VTLPAKVVFTPDSFFTLSTLRDDFADVIISDPPYPEEVQSNMCSGSLVGTLNVPKYDLPFPALSRAQGTEWLGHALRISKRWVITFCSLESFGRYQDAFGKAYVRGAVWAKSNAMGQLTGDRPATAFEGVAWLHGEREAGKVKKRWNGRGSYGIWSCNGTRGLKGRHPNEKPIDLAMKLVALASDRGETVFDPFAGSAAIGEACVRLGRGYIGLDFAPEWVEKGNARLRAAAALPPVTDEEALGLCRMWGNKTAAPPSI
jgi:DNA modification methylase